MRITRFALLVLTIAGCTSKPNSDMQQTEASDEFKTYTLSNAAGMKVTITPIGGHVMSIQLPDKNGGLTDVVLGYDSAKEYIGGKGFYGSTVGRYGNRIAKAKFNLEGKEYQLSANNGENSLHGGPGGFHNVRWTGKEITTYEGKAVELTYLSKDGEEGYPGNLNVKVVFSLTDSNELKIQYEATTDKTTVVNLTNHSYFNLAGEGNGDILNHEIAINADKFLPVDKGFIPTGELRPVKGTPFDFLQPHKIGERINADEEQVKTGLGYDHNFILNKKSPDELSLVAKVSEPTSGRMMEVWSTEPGVQFYTGNFLNGAPGKGGKPYNYRGGFCLETQHFPDSPNQPAFPSTVLKPGETYKTTTIYKFIW
ncbi:MAG TPA: aldose epimerase family protein [Cyclobacteriaceae bacterium]|nr:aldose epimerase family protein [Cyclobacteriaceae bacterium]